MRLVLGAGVQRSQRNPRASSLDTTARSRTPNLMLTQNQQSSCSTEAATRLKSDTFFFLSYASLPSCLVLVELLSPPGSSPCSITPTSLLPGCPLDV